MIVLLIEAEQFASYGGWVLDQQFMDEMGSPYLLAHGLAQPVADARTTVSVAAGGTYRVWVRTFDWVAPWEAPGAPGRFQVLLNGTALPTTFGTSGANWHWQDGGTVELPEGRVDVALHDLTGCEGRCDALLLCEDLAFVPPEGAAELASFRRQTLGLTAPWQATAEADLVVVGGGIAGICAAVCAARLGLAVVLLQDRPVLGGNNSSEVRVNISPGDLHVERYPGLGVLVRELDQTRKEQSGPGNVAENFMDDRRLAMVRAEPNLALRLGHRVVTVEKEDGLIKAVIAQDIVSGKRTRITGRWFADCTGDGAVGFLAGADFDMHMTGHMGPSNLWHAVDTGAPVAFPPCPWALDLRDKPFPGRAEAVGQWCAAGLRSLGQWFWESGFDQDPITEAERIRDTNFRAMYGAWDALKNTDGLYPHHRLDWAAFIAGKRESRRLLGDVVVTRGDLYRQRRYPDGCIPCTWHMDLHVPHTAFGRGFEGEEFISWCVEGKYPKPFWLPYRALYSRNVPNLFMAGRDISVTHEALGAVRVQHTTGMMGEVISRAAALCQRRQTTPRGVYAAHWEEFERMLRVPAQAAAAILR